MYNLWILDDFVSTNSFLVGNLTYSSLTKQDGRRLNFIHEKESWFITWIICVSYRSYIILRRESHLAYCVF